jgi:glycosyl transferase family 25
VINLDGAAKRWSHIEATFTAAGLRFERVPAIDGRALDIRPAQYSEHDYRRRHGRQTNPPEIGCYLSHLKAIATFLETDAELALICEDDVTIGPDIAAVLEKIADAPRDWNILRLTGLSEAHPLGVRPVLAGYFLCINFARFKGTGAYVIDRKAARAFTSELLPMKLPYDHAIDREWLLGLAAASVLPFPITQKQKRFGSSIQTYAQPKLPMWRRCLTTYPYQALNEVSRWIFRAALFLRLKVFS